MVKCHYNPTWSSIGDCAFTINIFINMFHDNAKNTWILLMINRWRRKYGIERIFERNGGESRQERR